LLLSFSIVRCFGIRQRYHFREWWRMAKLRMILSFNGELSSLIFSLFATRKKGDRARNYVQLQGGSC